MFPSSLAILIRQSQSIIGLTLYLSPFACSTCAFGATMTRLSFSLELACSMQQSRSVVQACYISSWPTWFCSIAFFFFLPIRLTLSFFASSCRLSLTSCQLVINNSFLGIPSMSMFQMLQACFCFDFCQFCQQPQPFQSSLPIQVPCSSQSSSSKVLGETESSAKFPTASQLATFACVYGPVVSWRVVAASSLEKRILVLSAEGSSFGYHRQRRNS